MNLLRIRNSSVRLRALLLPAVALALAGGAVSAPAASASIKPACGWQNLELVNGWVSANTGTSNTGDPMYCVAADGSVYLAGSITHTPGASAEFALLPPQALPPTTQGFNVFTNGNTTGALAIAPTGEMYVVDITSAAGSAAQFTSLDGVSFPATESNLPINPLTPQNGWNVGAGGAPGYYLTGGVVHLTGSVTTNGLPNHSPLATLPAGGRPTRARSPMCSATAAVRAPCRLTRPGKVRSSPTTRRTRPMPSPCWTASRSRPPAPSGRR